MAAHSAQECCLSASKCMCVCVCVCVTLEDKHEPSKGLVTFLSLVQHTDYIHSLTRVVMEPPRLSVSPESLVTHVIAAYQISTDSGFYKYLNIFTMLSCTAFMHPSQIHFALKATKISDRPKKNPPNVWIKG